MSKPGSEMFSVEIDSIVGEDTQVLSFENNVFESMNGNVGIVFNLIPSKNGGRNDHNVKKVLGVVSYLELLELGANIPHVPEKKWSDTGWVCASLEWSVNAFIKKLNADVEMTRRNQIGSLEFMHLFSGITESEVTTANDYFLWMNKKCSLKGGVDKEKQQTSSLYSRFELLPSVLEHVGYVKNFRFSIAYNTVSTPKSTQTMMPLQAGKGIVQKRCEEQVGAIAPQNLEPLLQSIHECLSSTDWATRKAAADTLSALALHSSNLIKDMTASPLKVLEVCRFDKGSMMAPHINPTATEYGIVLRGSGTVQIVYPNGTLAMDTQVRERDVFWVPRYFPFCQISSRAGPFEFFVFTTSSRKNRPQFLVGQNSLLQTLSGPETAAAFGMSEERYNNFTGAQHESTILHTASVAPPDYEKEKTPSKVTKMLSDDLLMGF